jgi:drug/metabolite transporter (DMT)-like permease
MLLWGTLPISLKIAAGLLDAYTLTWFRFAFAAVALGVWLHWRGELQSIAHSQRTTLWLLLVAGVTLIGNYLGYLVGLKLTTPTNAQLLIQSAPLLLALGGIAVFAERYTRGQWFGLALTTIGLLVFFSEQRARASVDGAQYQLGGLVILLAALSWAIYGLAQKQLLLKLKSTQVLWIIYLLATIVLLPLTDLRALGSLSAGVWIALIYCALNTIGAYGAFAEALAHWEASRVSAILSLSPLMAFLSSLIAHQIWPDLIRAESVGWIGAVGGLLVIGGAMLTSLARRASGS